MEMEITKTFYIKYDRLLPLQSHIARQLAHLLIYADVYKASTRTEL